MLSSRGLNFRADSHKVCARYATGSQRLEYRKASAAQQAMNERGDKHSLAGVRKPGDTKPDCGVEQMAAELDECSGSEPSCFNELKQDNGSWLPPAQQSPLSAACQRMIAQKHYHSANDCNNHAPDVETGYALHANRAEENSSDNRTDDA